MMTLAPRSLAVTAAATPAAPKPTTTTTASTSQESAIRPCSNHACLSDIASPWLSSQRHVAGGHTGAASSPFPQFPVRDLAPHGKITAAILSSRYGLTHKR